MDFGPIDYLYGVYGYGKSKQLPQIIKVVRNWYTVVLFRLGLVSSFYLEMRGEKCNRIWIGNRADYDRFWRDMGVMELIKSSEHYKRIRMRKDSVEFQYRHKTLKFYYDNNEQLTYMLSLIDERFWNNEYGGLEIKNNTVIDIGAYVGDSAIYFAMNGARHTYGFEPYPYAYRIAKRNVSANRLEGRITLVNAGCDSRDSYMRLGSSLKSNPGSRLEPSRKGKRVKVMSLDTIARKYCGGETILKMDCEGYEYPIILNSSTGTLRRFKQMVIEYHDGCRNLEERLRKAGFYVRHDRPKMIAHFRQALGLIFASRIDAKSG